MANYKKSKDNFKEKCEEAKNAKKSWENKQEEKKECKIPLCPSFELQKPCDQGKTTWTDYKDEVFKALPQTKDSDNAGMMSKGTDWTLAARITPTMKQLKNGVYDLGDNELTVHAIDDYGNERYCKFNVEVVDEEPPSFDCPPGEQKYSTEKGSCFAPSSAWNTCKQHMNTARDSQGPVKVTYSVPIGDPLPPGKHPMTWTATDQSGNIKKCLFTITVDDTEAPKFDCPSNADGKGLEYPEYAAHDRDADGKVIFKGPEKNVILDKPRCILRDNCVVDRWRCCTKPKDDEKPVCFNKNHEYPLGVTHLNCKVWDKASTYGTGYPADNVAALNKESEDPTNGDYEVDVEDTEEPSCTPPADIERILENHEHNASVVVKDPIVTDNYPGVTWKCISPENVCKGTELVAGEYEVEFIATDTSGNTNPSKREIDRSKKLQEAGAKPCTLQIVIKDLTAPDWGTSCPSNQTATGKAVLEVDSVLLEPYGIPKWTKPIATDASNKVTYNTAYHTLVGGAAYPLGYTTITYIASDPSNNQAVCEFTVVVTDREKPRFRKQPLVERTCQGKAGVATGDVCGGWEIKFGNHDTKSRMNIDVTGGALKTDKACCKKGDTCTKATVDAYEDADVIVKVCTAKEETDDELITELTASVGLSS